MCGYSEVSPNILLPLYSCFLIQFSKGQVKSAENLHMPICFLSKNEKKPSPFSNIDFFLIMFPLNLLTVCSMCMVCQPSVPWSAHFTYSCCLLPLSAVAVCRCNHYQRCHRHQPITAIVRIGDLLLRPPLSFSWDIQVKVPFTKARPWATLPPELEANFCAWRICAWLHILVWILISISGSGYRKKYHLGWSWGGVTIL